MAQAVLPVRDLTQGIVRAARSGCATEFAARRPSSGQRRVESKSQALVQRALYPGADCRGGRVRHRRLVSENGYGAETARGFLRSAHPHDDRSGDLLRDRARDRVDERPEKVGTIGVKTLVYFEIVSTLAL